MELKDKVAVVTGAGKGIGRVIAKRLFKEGAKVSSWDKDFDLVKDLSKQLDPSGKNILSIKADVTVEGEIQSAVEQTVRAWGKIDILVNNAGISRHKTISEMSVDDFMQVIWVNLTGTFICCKYVVLEMQKHKRGKIINISSLGGRTGRPGVGVNYAASKAGIIGLTRTLAREVGGSGIYVNAICPGPILTEQTKQYPREVFESWNVGRAIQRDGYPEDVADAVVFLASEKSDWITGASLDINGGIYIC
jgi:3-oxoacyl-[acyl-carrier protein] reductase